VRVGDISVRGLTGSCRWHREWALVSGDGVLIYSDSDDQRESGVGCRLWRVCVGVLEARRKEGREEGSNGPHRF